MRFSNTICLASTNDHKLKEYRSLFESYPGLELVAASDLLRNSSKIALVEIHSQYSENALAKARIVHHACHYPSLGDDSGLEIQALEGRPGIKSRRYTTPKAGQSQDESNMEKVLEELKGRPMAERSARFICSLALVIEGITVTAEGILEGKIAEAPAGTEGFGYDPIFIPEGSNQTLAQIGEEEKNQISHRARAIHNLMSEIKKQGFTFAKP